MGLYLIVSCEKSTITAQMVSRNHFDIISSFLSFCRLGLAYAGSNREDVLSMLYPVLSDSKSTMEVGE